MTERNQFRIADLMIASFFVAIAVWLFMFWPQIAILLCVTVLPATAMLWMIRAFRGRSLKDGPRMRTVLLIAVLSVVFFAIYVLSAGPMFYVAVIYFPTTPGDSTWELLDKFYAPIRLLDHPLNPLRDAMEWYFLQWQEAAGVTSSGT